MFEEYRCGCIVSPFVGRVRICGSHRPEMATGDGAVSTAALKGVMKRYPANGLMPEEGWSGK